MCEVEKEFNVTLSEFDISANNPAEIDCVNGISTIEIFTQPSGNFNYNYKTSEIAKGDVTIMH